MQLVLPIGFKKEGQYIKNVEVVEMDGYSRKIVMDRQFIQNSAKVTSALIERCLRVEEKNVSLAEVKRMFIADRNAVLIGIQKATSGDMINASYTCKWCRKGFEIEEDLSTLGFDSWDPAQILEEIDIELDKGYKDSQGNLHKHVTLRLPTGLDEEIVTPVSDSNFAEGTNLMLTRIITKFGTLDMSKFAGLGIKVVESLSATDIDKMVFTMAEKVPGFRLEHQVSCTDCGRQFTAAQDLSNFFVPAHRGSGR